MIENLSNIKRQTNQKIIKQTSKNRSQKTSKIEQNSIKNREPYCLGYSVLSQSRIAGFYSIIIELSQAGLSQINTTTSIKQVSTSTPLGIIRQKSPRGQVGAKLEKPEKHEANIKKNRDEFFGHLDHFFFDEVHISQIIRRHQLETNLRQLEADLRLLKAHDEKI